MLKQGHPAPPFTLTNTNGDTVSLSDYRGKKVILYFYPKDNTPGCTAEACNLRDNNAALKKKGFVVLGISPDKQPAHQKFTTKYNLPFPLLSDPDHRVAETYGAWGEKKFMGRKYNGILRTTFIINEQGKIQEIITKVDTKNHTAQILALLGESHNS